MKKKSLVWKITVGVSTASVGILAIGGFTVLGLALTQNNNNNNNDQGSNQPNTEQQQQQQILNNVAFDPLGANDNSNTMVATDITVDNYNQWITLPSLPEGFTWLSTNLTLTSFGHDDHNNLTVAIAAESKTFADVKKDFTLTYTGFFPYILDDITITLLGQQTSPQKVVDHILGITDTLMPYTDFFLVSQKSWLSPPNVEVIPWTINKPNTPPNSLEISITNGNDKHLFRKIGFGITKP